MANKKENKKGYNKFPEPEKLEITITNQDGTSSLVNNEEQLLTPSEYFEKVKNMITEETSENIISLYNIIINKLKKYTITGQKSAAKELYAKALYLQKEYKLIEKGVTKYVTRQNIEKYINDIADDCVCVIEMKNFDRPIPDEIVDIVADTMDIFDEFYIVFTDYTGEKRSKVEQERREKDPILFGNIFIDGRVSDKMYFLGDWIDEYCDLTLDKMIEKIAKEEKIKPDDIVYNINDSSTLEKIKEEINSKSTLKTLGRTI